MEVNVLNPENTSRYFSCGITLNASIAVVTILKSCIAALVSSNIYISQIHKMDWILRMVWHLALLITSLKHFKVYLILHKNAIMTMKYVRMISNAAYF